MDYTMKRAHDISNHHTGKGEEEKLKYTGRLCALIAAISATLVILSIPVHAQVTWLRDAANNVNVVQSITGNSNGTWTYNYTIRNIGEANRIWWLVLYYNSLAINPTPAGDITHSTWSCMSASVIGSDIYPPDGQSSCTYTYDSPDPWPNVTPHGVGLGESLSGFSITCYTYDPTPKRFVYDVEGDWGEPDNETHNLGHNSNGDQVFSGGGWTTSIAVPEPSSILGLLFGIGSLSGFVLRRKK